MESLKHILVTGGAGYIGSHTVVELAGTRYVPVILDDFRNAENSVIGRIEKITGQPVAYITAACQEEVRLRAAFEKYDFYGVIHFAADKAVAESVLDPLKYYDNNLNSLLSLLRVMQEFQTKHFVFSSSCTVYGNPETSLEVSEEIPVSQPTSPYGNTKLIAERIIADWAAVNPAVNVALLRYFNPVGAHPSGWIGEMPLGKPNNLLPYLTQTARGVRDKLTVYGSDYDTIDGSCVRDYIHVCDLAIAHVQALNWLELAERGTLEAINIGTGQGTSVLEVIRLFEEMTGEKLRWEFGPRRPGDVPEIFANAGKARELLNWKAGFTVADALRDAWNWENKRIDHV
jgi:UDP-glucose 4-epimerase